MTDLEMFATWTKLVADLVDGRISVREYDEGVAELKRRQAEDRKFDREFSGQPSPWQADVEDLET